MTERGWKGVAILGVAVGGALLVGLLHPGGAPAAADLRDFPAPLPSPAPGSGPGAGADTVVFSGGCFWGVQAVFQHIRGVEVATAGYAGGSAATAHYAMTSTGRTGHAESVRVVFDPSRVSFGQLLQVFFSVAHDPTELDRQGPDVGTEYRSAIWTADSARAREARAYIERLDRAGVFSRKIVTEVNPLDGFYPAETYHQDYLIHHPDQPYIRINDIPKVEHLRERFPDLWSQRPAPWRPEADSDGTSSSSSPEE